jgi:hypothetical protein
MYLDQWKVSWVLQWAHRFVQTESGKGYFRQLSKMFFLHCDVEWIEAWFVQKDDFVLGFQWSGLQTQAGLGVGLEIVAQVENWLRQ